MQGYDTVFHVAAKAGIWGAKLEFEQTNVVGTRNVLGACFASGVTSLVYTSTPSVVFDRSDLHGGVFFRLVGELQGHLAVIQKTAGGG